MVSIFEQSELIFKKNEVKDSLLNAIWKNNHQKTQDIFKSNSNSDIQEILRSEYYSGRAIFDPDNLKRSAGIIKQIHQKADKNTYTFWKGKKTLNSLCDAVQQDSLKKVQDIFNSNSNSDIQKVLKDKVNNNYTVLDFAILKQAVNITKALWQKANEDTRILLSDSAIKLADNSLSPDVKKIILEIKNYRKQKRIEENREIATEKPTPKRVLQDAQLSKVNTNKARRTS